MKYRQLEFEFMRRETPKKELPSYGEPKNDNERLLNYQRAFRNGDIRAIDEMYKLGKTVAMKYIQTISKENKAVRRLNWEDKEGKAHNAITYIIARYFRVPGWAITDSFTGYLYLRVKFELFHQRKVDKIVRFIDMDTYRRHKDHDQ